MTDRDGTIPSRSADRPVRSFRVEVLNGEQKGASVTATDEPITVGAARDNTLQLSDPRVSGYHLELRRRRSRIEVRDLGSTNGTSVGEARFSGCAVAVAPGAELSVGRTRLQIHDGETMVVRGPPALDLPGVIAESDAMRRIVGQVASVASSDVPVLLFGESGTGKDVLARALHEASPRRDEPFVPLDCGAVTPSLFQSTLFGHERGAFTGADRRHEGVFEQAGAGTLFLDEIGELPLEVQASLLGVLERRTLVRVGGRDPLPVRARVICATHRDLRAEVNRERFRLDLYYRLAVVTVAVPPLRERGEDLEPLIERFAVEEGHDGAEGLFSTADLKAMRRHPWPGNARELRNVVLASIALGRAPELRESPAGEQVIEPFRDAKAEVVRRFEREYLERLLRASDGSVRKAAKLASMNRGYLTELLERHRLK